MSTLPAMEESNTREARALWIAAPRHAEIRSEALRERASDEVLIRTRYSALSRGTERLVFEGRVPVSEQQRMRAPMQSGEFTFPLKYGYASVGDVIEGPDDLRGRTVFCLAPHQTAYVAACRAVTPIPDSVPAARAILAANMETALNGTWDAEVKAGDRVVVVGAGVVGCLVAFLCARHPAVDITLVDIDPRKAEIARRLGSRFATPQEIEGVAADVVIHASGSPQGLVSALSAAGQEARIVELSWYGDATVTLPLGGAFHARRLTICSSQVGHLPASQQARWNHRRRMETALHLLASPELDALINSECSFDGLPERMPQLLAGEQNVLCHRVLYP